MSLDWKEYYAKYKGTYTKYTDRHREARRAYGREYYRQSKEKELERRANWTEADRDKLHEVIFCECGGHHIFRNKLPHTKTAKHQKYLANLNNTSTEESPKV